jgi:uncharacterized protein YdeI (YjbR/CyaY-like superfamily)
MSKIKHVANASALITEAFNKMPEHIRLICVKLRALIHQAEPSIIEDWKWGPNFYLQGKVCNVWGFKEHASIVFFNGVNMKDLYGLFNAGEDNSKSRTIKFTSVTELNDKIIIAYIKEAIELNKAGETKAVKAIEIPNDMEKILKANGLYQVFVARNFTYKKEAVLAFLGAKQIATRERRMEKLLTDLRGHKG